MVAVVVYVYVCVCNISVGMQFCVHVLGEFGIVYKAHLVKSVQKMPEIVAVKTLKG